MSQATTYAGSVEHDVGPDGRVDVRIASGEVSIRGTDATTARVVDLDGRDLSERFDIERGSGFLAVRARFGSLFSLARRSTRLALELPRGATVRIEAANGALSASGLRGEQRYRTASGDIDLDAVEGSIAVDSVSGTASIRATGPLAVQVRTVSGRMRVRAGIVRAASLSTTSGQVEVEGDLARGVAYVIETVSGDALVRTSSDVRVEAQSVSGRVRGAETGAGTGRDPAVVRFRSISGDLRLERAAGPVGGVPVAPAAPLPPADPVTPAAPVPPAAPVAPDAPVPPVAPDAPRGSVAERAADDDREGRRLAILRALERGEIDVDTATRQLAELDEGGEQ